jgi:hypothetical protein
MITRDSQERKDAPVFSGVLAYFPDALVEVARLSKIGNDKHNAGEPLHWSREKSADHADCIVRHQLEFDRKDENGMFHAVMVAWRALAQLQLLLEKDQTLPWEAHPQGGYLIDPDNWFIPVPKQGRSILSDMPEGYPDEMTQRMIKDVGERLFDGAEGAQPVSSEWLDRQEEQSELEQLLQARNEAVEALKDYYDDMEENG